MTLSNAERLINAGKLDKSNPPAHKLDKSADTELEQKLAHDLKHTLKLVPESQRELFVFELARYLKTEQRRTLMPTTDHTIDSEVDKILAGVYDHKIDFLPELAKAKLDQPDSPRSKQG